MAGVVLVGRDRDHDASVAMTVVGSVVGGGITLAAAGRMLDEHPAVGLAILGAGTALG